MKKLSFVIPIYNVSSYLFECYYSIYNQINDKCEIILVDDGSTDNSGFMCDELCEKNENTIVIHKKNGGLASARNAGLCEATGVYICFVDADDKIADSCVDKILNAIDTNDFDLCFMKGIKFYPNGYSEDLGDEIDSKYIIDKNKNDILSYLSSRPKFSGSSCTKIYRREFLNKNMLEFPHDNRQSEDLGFVRDCILKAKKYYSIDCPFYEYRQNRMGSISNGATIRGVDGVLKFIEETIGEHSSNKKAVSLYDSCALSFAAYEYYIALLNYSLLRETDENSILYNKIVKYKWIVKYTKSNRFKKIKYFIFFFGIKNTLKVLSFYYRNKKTKMY